MRTRENTVEGWTRDDEIRARRFAAIRQELDLRILIQNGLLVIHVLLAGAAVILMVGQSDRDVVRTSILFDLLAFSLAIMWSHSDYGHQQMGAYILAHIDDDEDPAGMGWERFLKSHRPVGLLGSKWFISTHGLWMGLPVAVALFAWERTGFLASILAAAVCVGAIRTAILPARFRWNG
jgi:hypothetical protein